MKLARYLETQEMTDADFARLIGVERQAVHRYRTGQRIPTKEILTKIFDSTGGAVSANDFFDLSAAPAPSKTGEAA